MLERYTLLSSGTNEVLSSLAASIVLKRAQYKEQVTGFTYVEAEAQQRTTRTWMELRVEVQLGQHAESKGCVFDCNYTRALSPPQEFWGGVERF